MVDESLDQDSAVVVFGDGREVDMVSSILERGVPTMLVTDAATPVHVGNENLLVVRLSSGVSGFARTMVETIVVQLMADELARLRGLDIDEFLFDQPDTKIAVQAG